MEIYKHTIDLPLLSPYNKWESRLVLGQSFRSKEIILQYSLCRFKYGISIAVKMRYTYYYVTLVSLLMLFGRSSSLSDCLLIEIFDVLLRNLRLSDTSTYGYSEYQAAISLVLWTKRYSLILNSSCWTTYHLFVKCC